MVVNATPDGGAPWPCPGVVPFSAGVALPAGDSGAFPLAGGTGFCAGAAGLLAGVPALTGVAGGLAAGVVGYMHSDSVKIRSCLSTRAHLVCSGGRLLILSMSKIRVLGLIITKLIHVVRR
jgi:hypothetical protein